ncbi:MAG: hypothetical protein ACREVL_12615 [Solimonas sp.]
MHPRTGILSTHLGTAYLVLGCRCGCAQDASDDEQGDARHEATPHADAEHTRCRRCGGRVSRVLLRVPPSLIGTAELAALAP